MFEWISQNIAAIAVYAALAVVIGGAAAIVIRNKLKGKHSCSCGCSGCANERQCKNKSKQK